jgi:crotonobetainyl-CoA:carnitine CoA-transferase CaiB-like acyl-CoA transferase
VPYQDFPTADGDIMIAVGNDGQFSALCGVRGHPEWAADARFSTLRVKNRESIIGVRRDRAARDRGMGEGLRKRRRSLRTINDLSAVFDDPHIKSRQLKIELPHPDRRHHAAGRKSDPDVRNAGRIPIAAAAARRTHTRRARRDPRPESHSDVSKLAENKIVQARGLS